MPEGHTIHRIARDHGKLLNGRAVRVSSPQGRFEEGARRLDGQVLEGIEAYGKHLFYHWAGGDVGHVHLGLFGKFRVQHGPPPPPTGAVRMRLEVDDTTIDLRGPTACTVGAPEERTAILARLGPDPLRRDGDPTEAVRRIGRSRKAIGALLLDQAVVAGIGNVYRAEVLFVHGIHPLRPGVACRPDELAAVWETASTMLRAGVKANRIVTVSRADIGWPRSRAIPRREATYVYHRERCVRCGDAIATVEVGGRPCYYCPTDQPA